jgi:hypothetical protein
LIEDAEAQVAAPDGDRPGETKQQDGPNGQSGERRRYGAVALVFACALPIALLVLPVLPMLIATPILAVGALIAGVSARRAARRTGGTAPGTPTAIAVGVIGLALTVAVAPFWSPLSNYEDCLTSANTVHDQSTCRHALDRGLASRVPFASSDFVGRLTSSG